MDINLNANFDEFTCVATNQYKRLIIEFNLKRQEKIKWRADRDLKLQYYLSLAHNGAICLNENIAFYVLERTKSRSYINSIIKKNYSHAIKMPQ